MSTEQSEGETQTAHSQVDITQQATNPAPAPTRREKKPKACGRWKACRWKNTYCRWTAEKSSGRGFCHYYKQQKRNTTPHHLILLQQKKIAAPLPSPNGFWLSALALHLWGFITNVKSSRSGPRSYYSAKKKMPEPALVETDPAPAPQPKGLRLMD